MRGTWMMVAAMGLALGAPLASCASKPKPKPVAAAGPSCPAMKSAEWSPILHAAQRKAFDKELQRRFGSTGTHILVDRETDAKGDLVVTGRRIGPAKFEMPEVGKGGEIQVVFQACTHKLLKTRKLADLEASPKPIAPNTDPET